MAHTNPWSTTAAKPAGGSSLSAIDTNIQANTLDILERMELEHYFNDSQTYDGTHIPAGASVCSNQDSAATIVAAATGSVYADTYTGSLAVAEDTGVMYVKKGTANATTGTWTPIIAQTTFVTSNLGQAAIFDADLTTASTWQDLDIADALSLTVTNPMWVFLEVVFQRASKILWFKPKGEGTALPTGHIEPTDLTGPACGSMESNTAGDYGYTIAMTNASGVMQIASNDASDANITIKVLGYIR